MYVCRACNLNNWVQYSLAEHMLKLVRPLMFVSVECGGVECGGVDLHSVTVHAHIHRTARSGHEVGATKGA